MTVQRSQRIEQNAKDFTVHTVLCLSCLMTIELFCRTSQWFSGIKVKKVNLDSAL